MPHDKYNIRCIAHARTNRKGDIFKQRRLFIDKAHTVLGVFRFAFFLLLNTLEMSIHLSKDTIIETLKLFNLHLNAIESL